MLDVSFEQMERLATEKPIALIVPFINFTKTDIVKLGHELGVPFKYTWSCYKGKDVHCGICSTCAERKKAFIEAGIIDPTQYEGEN